ncbi:ASCH domain-containing protein [Alkalicoccus halolimnae]|uniref:ASCH domain-containing protein n=1 Tax=Alkalicoccus halolimnae TaxID=1667239 RepID=A0A5C7FDI6_9BACI|nr:ASCH domain-containing protein [Alkalicoccus halolimnae]TXF85357.1 ASCH domain-containing protein [Alkalicoccus halolimnae]
MNEGSISRMWEDYKKNNPDAPDTYEAWAFGDSKEMADELAELVKSGTKTATASNYSLYGDDEPLPYSGMHNIVLDGEGTAAAVIVTTTVDIVPFDEVTEEHAWLEGEGERTLAQWRRDHEAFFKREFAESREDFHEKMPVVCERFKLVYK